MATYRHLLRFVFFGVCAVLAVCASPSSAARHSSTPVANQSNLREIESRLIQVEAQQALIKEQAQAYRSEAETLRVRDEVQQASSARVEILVGFFSALVTVLVIAFGFRTERAAALGARIEISEYRSELDKIILDSRNAAEAAQRAADAAASASAAAGGHADSVAAQAAEAAEQMVALREAAMAITSSRADQVRASPKKTRASGGGSRRVLSARQEVLRAYNENKLEEMIKIANMIVGDPAKSDDDYAFGLYFKAVGLGRQGQSEAEIDLYSKIIDMFSMSDEVEIKSWVSSALISRALTFALSLDRASEERDYDAVIELYGGETDQEIKSDVAEAFYWKAANLARDGKIREPILLLKKWEEYKGSFVCGDVFDSSLFEKVRDSQAFRKLRKEKGC